MSSDNLVYLGILPAPVADGRKAVAVALTGAVELYHFVDAGLDIKHPLVDDWLWLAGINSREIASALPPAALIKNVILPAIGNKTLVVAHEDVSLSFVDELIYAIRTAGGYATISSIELKGPIAMCENGAAGRRAFALQARYEAALDTARKVPAIHRISGQLGDDGQLTLISIDGLFSKRSWTIESEADAIVSLIAIAQIGEYACFVIDDGPAQNALKALASEFGIEEKQAA